MSKGYKYLSEHGLSRCCCGRLVGIFTGYFESHWSNEDEDIYEIYYCDKCAREICKMERQIYFEDGKQYEQWAKFIDFGDTFL